jgi:beta-glucanase (GH16 family)
MKSISRWAGLVLLLTLVVGVDSAASAAVRPKAPTLDCGAKVLKPNGKAWRCTFADNFNGTGLDGTKWRPLLTSASNLHGGGDCWVGNGNTIAVADGTLRLTSRREDSPFTCTKASGETFEAQISSGSVSTYGKFAQTYGRWEIRARFPEITLPGSQGALWMTPYGNTYGGWPASGEIDIAEFYSLYPDRVVPYIHYILSGPDGTETNTTCMVADPWNFHTYTLVWSSGRLVISIDVATCVDHAIHAASPLSGSQPFDKPFVVNLTQTMGMGNNAPIDGTPLPLTTEVDYVRVWS